MDQLQALRVFVKVAENGSFSAAGRELGLAPSSVSRLIGELEADMGARLVNRTTRKLSLSEAGFLLQERAQAMLFDLEEARLAVSELGSAPSGVLRVTAPSGIARELIVYALPAFQARYPAIKIVMLMVDHIVDLVDDDVDVAIRVGRLKDSGLIARKLGDSRRVLCASPAYLAVHGSPRHPGELEGHACLTWRDRPGVSQWGFKTEKNVERVGVTGKFFAANADALVAAALAGLGLICMPDWNMGSELRAGRLVPVMTDYEPAPETSPVHAVFLSQRHVPPKVRAFVDFMAAWEPIARFGEKLDARE